MRTTVFTRGCWMASAMIVVLLAVQPAWSTPPSGGKPSSGGWGFSIPIPIPSVPLNRPNWQNTPSWQNTPRQPYYPTPSYEQPQTITPPVNVEPIPNEAPIVLIEPLINTSPFQATYVLTSADIQTMKTQMQDRNAKVTNAIVDLLVKDLDVGLGKLPGFDKLTADQKDQIRNAVKQGNDLSSLLSADQKTSASGQRMIQRSDAVRSIFTARTAADAGSLSMADLTAANNRITLILGAGGTANTTIEENLGVLGFNSEFIKYLGTAVAGNNTVPRGADVAIILVPGLAGGRLLPLGNGAVVMGTGWGSGDVIVGTGSVATVSGLGSIGSPARETSEGRPTTKGVVLRNETTNTVNYTVNDSVFKIAGGYVQTLPAGRTWLVGFDRGGDFGAARYSLTEGTYDFMSTSGKGWDLFKQTFEITIDNSRSSVDFHYTLQNARQSVAAGKKAQHSGDYALVVRFDNAKSQIKQKLLEQGVYRVALTDDHALDLFPPNSVPADVVSKSDTLPAGFKMFANPFAKKYKLAANVETSTKSSINLFAPTPSNQ